MKKTKAPMRKTPLDRIVAQLHTVLRRTTRDVIVIGNLLIKSREHLEHGEWQPWLEANFDLTYRTAINYCNAAEFAERVKGKSDSISHLANLSATVLYALADGRRYTPEEEAAILAKAKTARVDEDTAWSICEALEPPYSDEAEEPDEPVDDAVKAIEAAEDDPEIAAILHGPPPAVPPPAPLAPPPDFNLGAFEFVVRKLIEFSTKPAAQFASTVHSASDLEKVESFIRAVAAARKARSP